MGDNWNISIKTDDHDKAIRSLIADKAFSILWDIRELLIKVNNGKSHDEATAEKLAEDILQEHNWEILDYYA